MNKYYFNASAKLGLIIFDVNITIPGELYVRMNSGHTYICDSDIGFLSSPLRIKIF